MYLYKGRTKTIKLMTNDVRYTPEIPVPTLIADHRISNSINDSVSYIAKPGEWMTTTNEDMLLKHKNEIINNIKAEREKKIMILRYAFASLIIIIIVYQIYKYYKYLYK